LAGVVATLTASRICRACGVIVFAARSALADTGRVEIASDRAIATAFCIVVEAIAVGVFTMARERATAAGIGASAATTRAAFGGAALVQARIDAGNAADPRVGVVLAKRVVRIRIAHGPRTIDASARADAGATRAGLLRVARVRTAAVSVAVPVAGRCVAHRVVARSGVVRAVAIAVAREAARHCDAGAAVGLIAVSLAATT